MEISDTDYAEIHNMVYKIKRDLEEVEKMLDYYRPKSDKQMFHDTL